MANFFQWAVKKLRSNYRLIIYNDDSFEEVLSYRLNRLNVFILVSILSLILSGFVYLLIAFTPLKEYMIPDYPKSEERQAILRNAMRVDSLEYQLGLHKQYLENLRILLSGGEPPQYINNKMDTTSKYKNMNITRSREDSLLRKQVESEEAYSLTAFDDNSKNSVLKAILFFPPVRGLVTDKFNSSIGHFGIDVVSSKDDVVHATLDGTVVYTDWSVESGFVIQIQHDNNMVSIYKHNSKLLKRPGNVVKSGEAIAIIGNAGELSNGVHLHFELWEKGTPINPEEYIVFK